MKKIVFFITFIILGNNLYSQTWIQLGNTLYGENSYDWFGYPSDINANGDIIVVGAPGNDNNGNNAGQMRVFKNISGIWTQLGNTIYGNASEDEFGRSPSINYNGNIVAVGAPYNDSNGNNAGQVRIFEFNGTSWLQKGNSIEG